jgi:hypothetical protein
MANPREQSLKRQAVIEDDDGDVSDLVTDEESVTPNSDVVRLYEPGGWEMVVLILR